jgi:hypothetical protein
MPAVNPADPTDIVRHGYDAVSHLYRRDDDNPTEYRPWLAACNASYRRAPASSTWASAPRR